MRLEDLKVLSQFGQALFVSDEPGAPLRRTVESVAASSLLDLNDERMAERASKGLLAQAEREGPRGVASQVQNPFFRLPPEQRLILSALHQGRWSYARLGRVVDAEAEDVARMAWAARLQLASAPGRAPLPHPTGSPLRGAHCPEYDAQKPWTQQFLDDETSTRERLFLQNHLMACESCRRSLNACRRLYFAIEKDIPRLSEDELAQAVAVLQRAANQGDDLRAGRGHGFLASLVPLIAMPRIQVALVLLGVLMAVKSLKG